MTTATLTATAQFEVGKTYKGMHNGCVEITVLKRTAKFITYRMTVCGESNPFGDTERRKISIYKGYEVINVGVFGDVKA